MSWAESDKKTGTVHKRDVLSDVVNTFGQAMLQRYGERVHKVAINAAFTCPNRDGSKGRGGCTFCNNASFNPASRHPPAIASQIASGRKVLQKRTGAKKYIAYFQAYSNTYAELEVLKQLYSQALAEPDVIGLSIGTRPDCVSADVLEMLAGYRDQGYEIWLELGLQSAFDETLQAVNRGHGYAEYQKTLKMAQELGLQVCTHLILGLPGETQRHWQQTLHRVLEDGVDGLKLHPLHVVKHTLLAKQWRQGDYQPLEMEEYVDAVARLVNRTPPEVVFHRLTGTASPDLLLEPVWCSKKWQVLNAIYQRLSMEYQPPDRRISLDVY
jgi:radical SAM protein (TIGR01212 family)